MSYSQNSEEQVILEYFKDFVGRFLDIGIFDGKTFSNTLALAERGWSGVGIEPSPTVFNALVNVHGKNEKIECVNAALATKRGLVQLFDSNGDAVSTTSPDHAKKWATVINYKKFWVNTITIEDIINTFGEHYDMINLDVEGTNMDLLRTLPLERMGVKLICIEHDYMISQMLDYCKGFKMIHNNGENIILVK